MKRYRIDFVALTPSPVKTAVCIEAESPMDASKQLLAEFKIQFVGVPNRYNPKLGEIRNQSNDPELRECSGCSICSVSPKELNPS